MTDQDVLEFLSKYGPARFYQIDAHFSPKRWPGDPQGFRVTDRALQRLRKAGKIQFSHAEGWMVVR